MSREYGFWLKSSNQKKFMLEFAQKFNIQSPEDWGKITQKQFVQHGGRSIMSRFENSLLNTLKGVFSDIEWKSEWFDTRKGYWQSKSNQRKFLDEFAVKFEIKTPQDWTKITLDQIISNGGATLLHKYNNSIFETLKNVYQDIEWQLDWFNTTRNWTKKNVQLKFLEDLKEKFKISNPEDWASLSNRQVRRNGGKSLLTQHGSLHNALVANFPETKWKKEWFSKPPGSKKETISFLTFSGYWSENKNQRNFLEKFAENHKIKRPSDWGKVRIEQIKLNGGSGLLAHYGGSLFRALKVVYADVKWKVEWFENISKYDSSYWSSKQNQMIFLSEFAQKNGIIDWSRASLSLFKKNGGSGLLKKYEGSIFRALESNFPGEMWFATSRPLLAKTESNLESSLQQIFCKEEMWSRFKRVNKLLL